MAASAAQAPCLSPISPPRPARSSGRRRAPQGAAIARLRSARASRWPRTISTSAAPATCWARSSRATSARSASSFISRCRRAGRCRMKGGDLARARIAGAPRYPRTGLSAAHSGDLRRRDLSASPGPLPAPVRARDAGRHRCFRRRAAMDRFGELPPEVDHLLRRHGDQGASVAPQVSPRSTRGRGRGAHLLTQRGSVTQARRLPSVFTRHGEAAARSLKLIFQG